MNTPSEIYKEYEKARQEKAGLGKNGMYEQSLINRRFYLGDQWYGANVSNERPLVRHNIIRRIGEYKMGDLLRERLNVSFFANGIGCTVDDQAKILNDRKKLSGGEFIFDKNADEQEFRLLTSALSDYLKISFSENRIEEKLTEALKNSFITGTGVLYSYWDTTGAFGLGDVACEVLPIENLYFGDSTCETVEKQPYIIIVTRPDTAEVQHMAEIYGGEVSRIKPDSLSEGKTTVFTKLYKKGYGSNATVMAVSVTEKAVVRPEYDTRLNRYPVNIFSWEAKENCIYGESEVTHLLPNQIAINRLLSASVWSSMYMGMPIMTVNGDTVTEDITNDPGQIIKVYGTNEDVAGAVKYVAPPDFSSGFNSGVSSLIQNTLEGCGAGMTTLGKLSYNNTAAIESISSVSGVSALSLKTRYRCFLSDIALTFLCFFMTYYGNRRLLIEDQNGRWYFPFNSDRYKNLKFSARCEVVKEDVNESN
ncbi:MAG: hypothetical protein IJ946_06830 [Clostridia bacterium]|nr:hypothetical protein [Clostridia bacterium]